MTISTTLHKHNGEISPNTVIVLGLKYNHSELQIQSSPFRMNINEFWTCSPKSAQSNHGLTLIRAHDQSYLDRKLTKIEALFSDWNMTVRNSKSDLHRSYWRSMSHEPLLQISDRSAHRRSWIGPLMKSRQWKKKLSFSLSGGCKKK